MWLSSLANIQPVHLVSFKPARTILIFSGFVVDVLGEWFYITAGHILRGISTALEAGSAFDIWRLDDQTAGNRFHGAAVPYDFDLGSWLVLRNEAKGLDYAAVHLDGLYRRLLAAGGVSAIASNAWSNHAAEHDHWVLMGIPSESVAYDGATIINARVVVVPVAPADVPTQAGEKAQNQFYASVVDGSEAAFKDADGLSGGPVFSLKKRERQWLYGLIGVQSAWYPTTRTLAICPFSSFGLSLEELIADATALRQS